MKTRPDETILLKKRPLAGFVSKFRNNSIPNASIVFSYLTTLLPVVNYLLELT